ncbi:MAG: hypothetical protein AAGB12_06270 [Pseudomonadota bacterium]
MQLSKRFGLVLLLPMVSTVNYAAEITFNGFLSVGMGYLSVDDPESYIEIDPDTIYQDQYFSFQDGDVNFDNLTKFGFQANAEIDENISITGQFISRGESDYDTALTWAYASYRFNDAFTLRAGRLRVPLYMYSDFLDVGYAYPWIRPPAETYAISPFEGIDGVDLIHTSSFGDWYSLIQLYYGNNNDQRTLDFFNDVFDFDVQGFTGITWTFSNDYLSARVGYHLIGELTATSDSFDGSLQIFNDNLALLQQAAALAGEGSPLQEAAEVYGDVVADLPVEEKSADYMAVGFELDWNNIVVISEWTSIELDPGLLRDTTTWYATLGYRLGDYLVHYTYERLDTESGFEFFTDQLATVDASSLGADIETLFAATDAGLRQSIGSAERYTHAFGVRYDVSHSAAIKAEFQLNTISLNDYDPTRVDPNITGEGTSSLFTVGFDLVF